MIQELFAGAGFVAPPDKKYSINNNNLISNNGGGGGGGGLLLPPAPPSSSSSSTPTSTVVAATSSNSSENLRCPRCDSSNTKFCYYNNYNLTQPRHFCKTCRRYWTKGGALRNVPIGGGCRKNKNIGVSNSSAAKAASATPKMKAMVASELRRSSSSPLGIDHHDLPAGPILWGSPQNSHLLALLRAGQSQNPNPNPNSMLMNGVSVKEERNYNMVSSTAVEPLMMNNNIPRTTLGYDGVGVGHIPQLDLCSSLWRSNNNNNQEHQPAAAATSFLLSEQHQTSSNGIQQLYHKLRSTPNNYATHNNSSPIFMPNMAASSSSSSLSTILESSSVSTAELGCWNNPTLPWLSDLPAATNGAYPN
ncbi:hypothetical protein HN51_068518 [Arachis hypogaea]|uniref:Dof zinc finger protein n=1 Tax=Arachis hypogaea TaxID=3818 RepID=A0A444ZA14_ARAHY|nr:dof zinc finger protein DOF1.1 [Arachis ipaensis]XP_025652798.1 dof zinc finger protein DOF1.1 [Arachis hypogaea]QHO10570.1 Dof zinc finger protein [Arachis hypogaea]RYR11022.1 hypothetical protein Ahy_B05g079513 [Arachis hypogaea]